MSATPDTPPRLLARLRTLQARLRAAGAGALLVTDPVNIFYLTGLHAEESWLLVRPRAERVHVLSDRRFETQIAREAPHVEPVMRRRSLAEALGRLARRLRLRSLGLSADHVTLAEHRRLEEAVAPVRLTPVSDGIAGQRARKDAGEIKAIAAAIALQEAAFEATVAAIEPGMREYEIAARLEYEMRCRGASGPSFPTIVAGGANAALPHAAPGKRRIRRGDLLLIDFGARAGGYCGDLTRVVGIGSMPPRFREIHELVRAAGRAAIEAIRPGAAVVDVDRVARAMIEEAGYGEAFSHGLGHGMGLEVHEAPRLSPLGEGVLEPGHVVTVEPGIYLPGAGGVRIEEDVLVTEKGHRVLSRLPADLESAII